MDKYTVTLSTSEMQIATFMAELIQSNAEKMGMKEMKVKEDGMAIAIQGMRSEIAFSKITNLHHDMNFNEHRHVDFYSKKGKRIDVKSTSAGRDLIVPKWNHHDEIDIYCLMTGKDDTWTYKGWTNKEDIINKFHWAEFLPVPAYLMRVHDPLFHEQKGE